MRNLRQACVLFHSYAAREELPLPHSAERASDCWPDWSSEQPDAETQAFADRNGISDVLRDIGLACAYLMVLVGVIGTMIFSLSR